MPISDYAVAEFERQQLQAVENRHARQVRRAPHIDCVRPYGYRDSLTRGAAARQLSTRSPGY
ncbi:MAG: hypothetical protein U5P41_07370 [Gammaproteobacteria bacterium]|nr:hypothetical protein [Gammaproteobacteria bacterium]